MIHDLARKIASWLSQELQQEERAAVMAYGLELLLGAVVKVVCFVTIPLLLGIFHQVMAVLLASVVFRLAAGGAHCTAYYRCLIGSLTTFTGLGFLARWLPETDIPARGMALAATLFAVIVALIWAPADTPAKPITRVGHRRALKIISLMVPLCYIAVTWFLPLRDDLVAASALGLAFQSFTVTPAGYRFIEWLDVFLGRLHSILIPGKGGVKNAA
ncbi:accessory gene regulator ArgB-like protein [Desulfofundulus thermocisternus]|uniref:accessory gene regulator ArgB-like protein n=1 Tax=Desulfofundulus thermocisternus TaxID=42471 RepID=UPI001A04F77C|nr:accessory gene regulator B family protein [Desulfofundulus thermocisternus]MBE3585588.1 accessory gene regulator B family protein [Thermoanaerobacter sp.]MCS5696140.1 accessory gene regulator B family protein [Desulfofundulus thermocisternus]